MSAVATNPYAYWQNALAGDFGPVHDGDAQCGFYRKRTSRAGPFVPVAIWHEDAAGMVCIADGKPADAAELWSYVCKYPISEEAYHQRVETGRWPDEDAAVAESLAPPDHNQGPTDEAEILKGQIDAASANMADYAEIKDDEAAAKAQSVRSRLLELSGQADKKREAEKKPHLEAGKAVDARWQPLVKLAKDAADRLRSALSAHETRKMREVQAAQQAEVERQRVEALNASPVTGPKAVLPVASPPQPVKTDIRGSYGRAAPIKAVKVARVTDQAALYPFLATHKEMIELMAKLAQRAVTAGLNPPGVEVTEERTVG